MFSQAKGCDEFSQIQSLDIGEVFKYLNYMPNEKELRHTLEFFSEKRSTVRGLFDDLQWGVPVNRQKNAIRRLSCELLPWEYIYLVMPAKYMITPNGTPIKYQTIRDWKSMWENAAKVVAQLGWPKVDTIIVPLFIWLLDPNWPGSTIIRDVIVGLPREILQQKVKEVLSNPQKYSPCDYKELKEVFMELL